jgi:class 3 adenylate cyclase
MAGELRAGDLDRERTAVALRDHFGAGRLSEEELSERLDAVYAARTVGELDALTSDLPGPAGAAVTPAPRRYVTRHGSALRTSVKIHATTYTLVNLLLIAIWAAAGGGYFWPIWPILGWGIGVAAHAAPVLAGAGTRRTRPPGAVEQIAESVNRERPSLPRAAAPDGTVTLLFSDIAASTELNDELGDVRWLELLRAHHALIRRQVRAHGGYEVKVQGDGFMVAFPSARRAIDCAVAIQATLGRELDRVRVRIGLHTGEALREDNDFYGRNVTLAARIAAEADAGEILASAVVKHLVESAGDLRFGPEREVELKGLGAYPVFAVQVR